MDTDTQPRADRPADAIPHGFITRLSPLESGDDLEGLVATARDHREQECSNPDGETDPEGCTELECTECGAPAGQPCLINCTADQATP